MGFVLKNLFFSASIPLPLFFFLDFSKKSLGMGIIFFTLYFEISQMNLKLITPLNAPKVKEEILLNYNKYKRAFRESLIIGANNCHSDLDFGLEREKLNDNIEKSVTGNYFIVFPRNGLPKRDKQIRELINVFENKKDIIDADNKISPTELFQGKSFFLFRRLGIIYTELSDREIQQIEKQKNYFFVEPERIVEAIGNKNSNSSQTITPVPNSSTWGIDLVKGASTSKYTGHNVNVAILDTGFDDKHPDFQGRNLILHYLVGNSHEDDNGHGMHCTGIAYGNKDHNNVRYGIASDAIIHSVKILDQNGYGVQGDIIAGLDWAQKRDCKVALLSVGISNNGTAFASPTMHAAMYKARMNDCIVVAGAGNDSNRNRAIPKIMPLASPADSQLSIAVGAIDQQNVLYENSNRAVFISGHTMNYVAPGVDIYSSWSTCKRFNPKTHKYLSGTSMAAPFVAGVLALYWEKFPNATHQKILTESRKKLYWHQQWNTLKRYQEDFGTHGVLQLP